MGDTSEINEFVEANAWLIRPCPLYQEEYRDCTRMKSRFHQYFIYGSFLDCTQWKYDTNNCEKWETSKDINAYKELVNSERSRRNERLTAHYANDTWERRTEPPPDWNKPLPEWLEKRNAYSYLAIKAEQDMLTPPEKQRTFCAIM